MVELGIFRVLLLAGRRFAGRRNAQTLACALLLLAPGVILAQSADKRGLDELLCNLGDLVAAKSSTSGDAGAQAQRNLEIAKERYNEARRSQGPEQIK